MREALLAALPALLDLALLGLTALAGWIAARLARVLRLSEEERLRAPLLALVEAMAAALRQRLAGALLTPPAAERAAAAAAAHVARSYPERMRRLGLDEARVADMLRVRLGLPPSEAPAEPRA